MIKSISSPVKGQPLLATWAGDVTDACNAVRAAGMVGTLCRDGAGAFGNAPLPANQRNRRATPPGDNGCWLLSLATRTVPDATTQEEREEQFPTLINRYYSVGEIAAHMDEDVEIDLSDCILQGELQDGQAYTADDKPYICLVVLARPPDPEGGNESVRIVAFKDWSELVEAQRNLSVVVRPLYKLSHYGTIVVDFRNMPQMQMTEVV